MLNTIKEDGVRCHFIHNSQMAIEVDISSYHKKWWCKRKQHHNYKWWYGLLNGITLLIIAMSVFVGTFWKESYAMVGLTAVATLIKGWNEFKKYSEKMSLTDFASNCYEKAYEDAKQLSDDEDKQLFLTKMNVLEEVIIDLTPSVPDKINSLYMELNLLK